MRRLRVGLLTLTFLAAVALAFVLAPSTGWTVQEARWLDTMLALRAGLGQAPPLDPRIRLIGIDDDTFQYLGKPTVFWDEDLGILAQGLLDGGAAVVALDAVRNVSTEKLNPAVAGEIERARLPLLRAITSQKLLLVDLPDSGPHNLGAHQHPLFAEAAAQYGNIANGVVVPGPDGIFRSILAMGAAGTPGQTPAFALRAVSLLTGQTIEVVGNDLRLGGVTVPVERDGAQWTVRLNLRRATYPWKSAAPLLEQLKAGQKLQGFEGTLCLIGPQSLSFGDLRASALDKLPRKAESGGTLGLELHAAAVESFLSRDYLLPYRLPVSIFLCVLLAYCFFYLGYRVPLRQSLLGAIGLQLLYFALVCAAFVFQGIWLPYVPVVESGSIGFFAGYLWRYLDIEAEGRRTRTLFSKMVAPQVVERVLSDPRLQALGGHNRRVTVLYTDINDFTPVCERHTPSEVIVMLNAYFEEMVHLIFRHEGMLKQFVGDEIMVIYGAPADQPDHAARAVRTALDMQDKLAEMLAKSGGEDGFFDIKIGIHTGDVVVGHVGAEAHMEYAAVGDDVNLGARIMATTKKVGVKLLVSAVTKNESSSYLPDVEWISQGVHSFKGKTAQMEIFEVRRKVLEVS